MAVEREENVPGRWRTGERRKPVVKACLEVEKFERGEKKTEKKSTFLRMKKKLMNGKFAELDGQKDIGKKTEYPLEKEKESVRKAFKVVLGGSVGWF